MNEYILEVQKEISFLKRKQQEYKKKHKDFCLKAEMTFEIATKCELEIDKLEKKLKRLTLENK